MSDWRPTEAQVISGLKLFVFFLIAFGLSTLSWVGGYETGAQETAEKICRQVGGVPAGDVCIQAAATIQLQMTDS